MQYQHSTDYSFYERGQMWEKEKQQRLKKAREVKKNMKNQEFSFKP